MTEGAVKVLLVDDDEDDYVITRDLICEIGQERYQLDWASSYDAGWDVLQRREHHICLVDYRLGERTGLEFLRAAQQLNSLAPMILLTGQGDHEVDLEAMKAGAADYLIKSQLNADLLERSLRYAIVNNRAGEHLRRDRDLISQIMETSPVGILVVNRAGRITFANRRAGEVLGLARTKMAQEHLDVFSWRLLDLDGHASEAGAPTSLKEVVENGRPLQAACHAVELGVPAAGSRLLLSLNAAPLFDAQNQIDGMVISVEDISGRLQLEAQLRQSQKLDSIGQLAAGVAHDINNILTIIQGHTGLLLQSALAQNDAAKSLNQISAAADRAARFVRQLLMFSRKQSLQTTPLDLGAVLRNLEGMLARLIGEDISLGLACGDEVPPRVEADLGMIEQIVMNLAVNARDAMPRGGTLTLATSTVIFDPLSARHHPEARAGSFVCLTVSDTGCGIEKQILPRIFDPFFSTKEVGRGTGLGLATVYGIVKQHRGWIEVESEPGAGTSFKVFLPVAALPETKAALEAAPAAVTVEGGRETILLVEDETGVRDLAREVLSQYRYRVMVAETGLEALRVWDAHKGEIDLLLTDMIMPGGMNGGELAAELKKRKPGLKIICSSGYKSELSESSAGITGVNFLPKPYLPPRLAQVVRETLDARQ
jgi:PAS domain S-box-containing protein